MKGEVERVGRRVWNEGKYKKEEELLWRVSLTAASRDPGAWCALNRGWLGKDRWALSVPESSSCIQALRVKANGMLPSAE